MAKLNYATKKASLLNSTALLVVCWPPKTSVSSGVTLVRARWLWIAKLST